MKCMDCPDYKACRRQNDLRRKRYKCKKANEPFVHTNADRIRAMRDEELAKLLLDGCRGAKCSEQPQNEMGSVNCFKCRVDWLRQPAKDGENDG